MRVPHTPGRFQGKTVIVTGAGSGIGRAVTLRLGAEGARVIGVDTMAERLEDTHRLAPEIDLVSVVADVTREEGVRSILHAAQGRVDGLANVAGITDGFLPIHELDDDTWERVLNVNVTGVMRMCRAVIPLMLEAGTGSIVNVSSAAGMRGSAGGLAYTVSKHAVHGITQNCSFMYMSSGVRTNTVAPGPTKGSNLDARRGSEFGAVRINHIQQTIMPPFADPENRASVITWLLSDDAADTSGTIIAADGGWSAI